MAIDFPASPTNGQTFTSGNTTYTWDGVKWTATVAGTTPVKIEVSNTKAEVLDTGSDGRFVVTTEGSERLIVTSAGLVGIGTSSVDAKFHVAGDSTDGTQARITGATNQNYQLRWGFDTTNLVGRIQSIHAGTAYKALALNPDGGSVGIGSSAPQTLLQVGDSTTGNGVPKIRIHRGAGTDYFQVDCTTGLTTLDTVGGGDFRVSMSGNEAIRVDASRRLLVGTSSAQGVHLLQIQGDSSNSSNPANIFLRRGLANASIGSGNGLGALLFGGQDGGVGAQIAATGDAQWGTNDYPTRLVFSTTADGASSPTDRMVIKSTGLVGIGIADPTNSFANGNGVQFDPIGVVYANRSNNYAGTFGRNTSTGDVIAFFYGSTPTNGGQVGSISVTGSATAYNTSSDYRLKENVVAVTDGIARLQQLKPSRFNFISDPDTTVDGFIAHEVQAIVPEAIRGVKDEVDAEGNPVYQGIDQSKLVPLLTAALQEAIGEIKSLKARVAALESA